MTALALLLAVLQERPVERVVIVSVDGLRPQLYLTEDWDMPVLRGWAKAGAHANAVESVFPSVTYAAHATIVTGVRPARHGVVANTKFGPDGPSSAWYWETADIKARTLWQAAREKGLKVAINVWPSTVGADVDWRLPERWAVSKGERTADLLARHATKGLVAELALAIGMPNAKSIDDRIDIDRFITASFCYVARRYRPQLAFVHLGQIDHLSHREGPDSEAAKQAAKRTDDNLKKIRDALEAAKILEGTALMIVGDHGFAEATEAIAPNVLLAEAGYVELEEGRLKSWTALVHAYGGSAAVYVKDPAHVAAVRELLEKSATVDGRRLYRVIGRQALDEFGYNRDAVLALDAGDGYAISGSVTGKFAGMPTAKGHHGHLPTREKLRTGFVAFGPGVKAGAVVERMHLVDIAPTVARLLGLEMKEVEGRAVAEVLR